MTGPTKRIVRSSAACLLVASLLLLASQLVPGVRAFLFDVSSQPQYCWLALGPNADVRVLVCLKGKALSLDHYVNGKPTGRTDQFQSDAECKDVTLPGADGECSYVITRLFMCDVPAGAPAELIIHVDVKGSVNYSQYCDVGAMAENLQKAPLSHFHGPLIVEVQKVDYKIRPGLALKRGDKPTDIRAVVGTMDAEKGCWVVVSSQGENDKRMFPDKVHPVVDVEFPSRDQAVGPIRRRYPLDKVC
ncbi:MAG TPA: hypothetical protein VGH74_03715 [Planctomycetaceae bacterium]